MLSFAATLCLQTFQDDAAEIERDDRNPIAGAFEHQRFGV